MNAIELIADDLFEKVRSRYTNLQMGDENGTVTVDPKNARFFDFDFVYEGNNLGRVSISINDIGNLKIFYSQSITENTDPGVQDIWFDFLREMRFFAKRRLLRFDTRDITKGNLDKTDFQYLAQNKPKDTTNMNESAMYGSSKTSHRTIEDTDLIIRHSEAIDPTKPGARSRKIKNLFIQNKEGERFKFPFIYLPGARAMQRHVANGGYPHDDAGKKIIQTCEEILKLSDFGRKVRSASLNDSANEITERAVQKLQQLRRHMECMSKQKYYEAWMETQADSTPSLIELDDATFESYKNTFTVSKFDEALAEVFPILHAIMQEANELKLDEYVGESQADEGYHELPPMDTDRYQERDGLEGPFRAKNGKVVYYDPREGRYYDPDTDIYIDHDEWDAMNRTSRELESFESWADAVIGEGLSDDQIQKLEPLVQEPMPVGANGEAIQTLMGIGIRDPELIDALQAVGNMPNGADADAREIIKVYLGNDATKLSWGEGETTPQEMPAAPESNQQPQAEDGDCGCDDKTKASDNSSKSGNRLKEVAKIVSGFYNREDGTWTKGEHGVVTHVKRRFSGPDGKGGEKEAALAAKLINHLNQNAKSDQHVAEMRRLAGLQ